MYKSFITVFLLIFIMIVGSACGELLPTPHNQLYFEEKNDDVISGNSKFAFEFLKNLNKEDKEKNLFISPYSISAALTMLYNGSNENTADEIAKALNYDEITEINLNSCHKYLKNHLETMDKAISLKIANSIWIRDGFNVKREFINMNFEVFDAYAYNLDFSKEDSADTINNWINKSTNGLISKMIEPPIPADIVMYLINAIYFQGDWKYQFNEERTYEDIFHNYDKTESTVDMMVIKEEFKYSNKDDYTAVRLPYGDDKVSMYCILPNEDEDINEFITSLTSNKWNAIKASMNLEKNVTVKLPKFKIEYGIRKLNDELKMLGMKEAFSDNANFSKITDNNDIKVSKVLHKAVIEVDEKGTEAAAITVVEMKQEAMIIESELPKDFIADRPFVFLIADDVDGTILFLGKLLAGDNYSK